MKWTGAVKAGKLANGFERGKGKVVHAIETKTAGIWGYSLCGQTPKISWTEKPILEITCPKCIKIMRQETVMSNILSDVDSMIKESK